MWPPKDMLTQEGYDVQWGIHVVGHWYFTELLMPALLAGVETSPDHHARVITTSSGGAYARTIDWDTLKESPERQKQSTENLYYQSKFVRHVARVPSFLCLSKLTFMPQGNVVVARQVAKRYGDRGIVSISLNPGASGYFSGVRRRIALTSHVQVIPRPICSVTFPRQCTRSWYALSFVTPCCNLRYD